MKNCEKKEFIGGFTGYNFASTRNKLLSRLMSMAEGKGRYISSWKKKGL